LFARADVNFRPELARPRDNSSRENIAQFFHPSDWSRVASWMRSVAESGASSLAPSLAAELRIGRRVQLHASPLAEGCLTVIFEGVARENPAALRSTTELHSLIEWIDQGVVLFDENEFVRAVNQRFSQLFGLSPEEVPASASLRDLVGVIAPRVSDPARFAERWWDAARGVEPSLREEVHVIHPVPHLLERISRPVLDSAGSRLGRVEIYRDLSTHQLFQTRLHKTERLAALGQKVSGVAHELSNPLTTILGYAQRLLRNAAGTAEFADVERIFSEAERASSILRQLLGSVRESASDRRAVELNPLILRTVELQRFQLAAENIRIELDLSPGLPPVLGDSGQLQQILMNLISNSRHALIEQNLAGTITLRTHVGVSGRVQLEFSDTGPGIPESNRHRIFDPFFTTKPAGIGTGLGLSIVSGLVHQNDSEIRLQNFPGRGASFLLDFPATDFDAPLLTPEAPASEFAAAPAHSGGRVLVVEDEVTVAQLIADMLSDLGYSSEVLHDARHALISALARDYSLVICDMKMSGLDGQHFYRALAEAGSPLASKFLFVTGDARGLATQEFLRTHRIPHIAKPFRLEEFAEKLSLVLRHSTAEAAAAPAARASANNGNLSNQG